MSAAKPGRSTRLCDIWSWKRLRHRDHNQGPPRAATDGTARYPSMRPATGAGPHHQGLRYRGRHCPGRHSRARALRHRSSRDRGSASVWVLAVGLAVVAVGVMGASIGAAVVARHQAQAAADLGALAAAVHALEGPAAACGRAARIVSANNGRMVSCRVAGLEAVVTAETDPVGLADAVAGAARASARAGPAHLA